MPLPRILVTGGSGKAGHWIIQHFLESGYDVINVDTRRPATPLCRTIVADLTQLGQTVSAFSAHSTGNRAPYAGVVHMAAIPRAHEQPNDEIFRVNNLSISCCYPPNKAILAANNSTHMPGSTPMSTVAMAAMLSPTLSAGHWCGLLTVSSPGCSKYMATVTRR